MVKEKFPRTIPRSPGGGLKESPVTKSEIIDYLKKNLSISISTFRDWYDEGIEITLSLDGDVISESRATIEVKRPSSHY